MSDDRALVVISAAQLATGVCGLALALRRRHAFDLPFWHGRPAAVGRDSLLMGTALSAPAVMLGAQAGAITALVRGPSPAARRLLGGLGAAMVAGYLAERLVRHRLVPPGWDTAESPVIVAGMSLAAAMALIGLRPAAGHPGPLTRGVLSQRGGGANRGWPAGEAACGRGPAPALAGTLRA